MSLITAATFRMYGIPSQFTVMNSPTGLLSPKILYANRLLITAKSFSDVTASMLPRFEWQRKNPEYGGIGA